MNTYVFKRNKYTNDVEISTQQGVVYFKWTLSGNYERAFTIYLLKKLLGDSCANKVAFQDKTVTATLEDKEFDVVAPEDYGRLVRRKFWSGFFNFLTKEK